MARSSRRAIDLIVAEEVTSRSVYERKYRHPEWPGVNSGVTIGIGYDVGQNTEKQFRADWTGVIPQNMVDALALSCGVTGERAAGLLSGLKWCDVPWDVALQVFVDKTLPRYEKMVEVHLPNWDMLPPDCFGALTSLVFNRGPSFAKSGDRYHEMRAIKSHMTNREFHRIPSELRSMKRIWRGQSVDGLLVRREREAKMFEDGLLEPIVTKPSSPPVVKPVPAPVPPAAPKPDKPAPAPQPVGWLASLLQAIAKIFGRKP